MDGSGTGITAVIENCDIHHNEGGTGIRLNGVVFPIITGCEIYGNGEAGIATKREGISPDQLEPGSSITIKGNIIGGSGQGNGGAGIYLKGSGDGYIQVTIGGSSVGDSNTISHNTETGIRLEDIDQVSMENNSISNNSEAGILLMDVSTASQHIKNNDIYDHAGAAGMNIGGASKVTIGDNNDIYSNRAGIVFDVSTNSRLNGSASSRPVAITGNNIYANSDAGIGIIDAITDTVTIAENNIHQNNMEGIAIQNPCVLEITKNAIHDNVRGGIHTGTDLVDGGGFFGSLGSAVLTIRQNKVYNNGDSGQGGGIDVRHASGSIYNNLVYENHRGGIGFGDWIDEIVNNTVANNGDDNDTPKDSSDDRGGGITYDDLAGTVNDLAGGMLSDSPNYPKPLIRNNVSAYNIRAGLRVGGITVGGNGDVCPDNLVYEDGINYRDYNLLYSNNGVPAANHCSWYNADLSCVNRNYGGCGFVCEDWFNDPNCSNPSSPNDLLADPLFKDIAGNNYRVQRRSEGDPNDSPAIGAGDDGKDMGAYGGSYPIDW